MKTPFKILNYSTPQGRRPFDEWRSRLRDTVGAKIILVQVGRLGLGNFSNSRFVGEGVWELRINFGPGYRVYYFRGGKDLIILLCGGDKSTQEKDILWAKRLKEQYTVEMESC